MAGRAKRDTVVEELEGIELELRRLERDTEKIITKFGAARVERLKDRPAMEGFHNGLLASHRDFDKFYSKMLSGERSAIVSGLNPSGSFQMGHIGVFDTNIFFQREHGLDVYAPISDDESYVAGKIATQEEGMRNSLMLIREYLAYGFDPRKTHFIIDQIYTNIYNIAIKLSKGINMTTLRAIYNYKDSDNIGLTFYPSVQSAHVIFPNTLGIMNVLVPIGPDEDLHLRACRDVAEKYGYEKPKVVHSRFLPGIDGKKMSKSKNNSIFLFDDEATIKRKISNAFSGGRATIAEHRSMGGIPENDIACIYLKYLFYSRDRAEALFEDYRKGRLLSGEVKKLLLDEVLAKTREIRERYNRITFKDLSRSILRNEDVDLESLVERYGIFSDER